MRRGENAGTSLFARGTVHLFGLRIELSGREGRTGRSFAVAAEASRFHHPTSGWSCASITIALGNT